MEERKEKKTEKNFHYFFFCVPEITIAPES
jgi:hypothetical protein